MSPKESIRTRGELTLALLATLPPFVLYLATLSGHSYWLDSGEFVAAALTLGVAHPPGHPLAALMGNLFSWLPIAASLAELRS